MMLLCRYLIPYQSPSTGLFSCNSDAYVRDSVYCSAAIWTLALAYRRYCAYNVVFLVITLVYIAQ